MRILVIEDETSLARSIAAALESNGLAADVAHDGEEGEYLATTHTYDAVILDLLLPKKAGLDVLAGLRSKRPALPVLVLTALGDVEHRVRGLDRGADDYLAKPFAVNELLARVRALLRRRNPNVAGAVVTVGDLEVDLAGHVVRRGGRLIALSPREYALLVLFVNRRGEALSRTEIGEHVVDREFESTSNLIDVSIYGLRTKLGKPELIHTVRGVGYRFDAEGSR
ncbi:MAG: response regulator transcription factor [Planctomycetes bacterium]|nr:response regulator transcription factor [Planctomycetota bacterium]MCC7172415.1 response regulator transcription factor [Planctomycetota bacterium]